MEDVYSIKVKTQPDTRNSYPSERRYSASTVSGLAWVHLALAGTSFLLACLAIVNPIGNLTHQSIKYANYPTIDRNNFANDTKSEILEDLREIDTQMNNINGSSKEDISNDTEKGYANKYSWIIIISPSLLTISALAAGIASIMASSRWYVDRNISLLFVMSILSTLMSLIAFIMILTWITTTSEMNVTQFYKDRVPFEDFVVVHKSNIVYRNESHIVISNATNFDGEVKERVVAKKVLSINILIACFLEMTWSLLSLKIAYKGMKSTYKDDEDVVRGGNCLVVTTIKGNNTRNAKGVPKPDLINHYPTNNKIKRFLNDGHNDNEKAGKPVNESGSEYRERMMNFLNRCASFDGHESNTDVKTPSVQSDVVMGTIPKKTDVETISERAPSREGRISTISWGDSLDHTIYNQNNLDLEKIIKAKIVTKPSNDSVKLEECETRDVTDPSGENIDSITDDKDKSMN